MGTPSRVKNPTAIAASTVQCSFFASLFVIFYDLGFLLVSIIQKSAFLL